MIHPILGCMLWGLFEVLFLFLLEYVLIIVSCFCDDSLRLLCMFLLRRGFHLNSRYNIRWPQKKTWIIFNLYIGQSIAQLRSIITGWCKESSPFLSDMATILADQHLRGTSLASLAWTRTRTTERDPSQQYFIQTNPLRMAHNLLSPTLPQERHQNHQNHQHQRNVLRKMWTFTHKFWVKNLVLWLSHVVTPK